ncbi:hypothetical protein A3D00_02245 [Candidatus Woesebacteria bacterium RIFCSPHIGHO2_02_FULL_38_9]|uniref:Glycosyltransferase 2-like domain-containing protein n=1 Tax=Candidatus Woesebacteria bacterium RIFCSPHIGHO2_01_FULL_39_28 TaxID=1802496 RepID=A0A1F7YF18_9BACT|nr:MAG: hypothetical protein A2627_02185 [Candidatus Woesebacteria bacterium RIFCSPHIGHO2_01_FULL_39_28]OGM32785.1 MAG: hypothetical protein A3D00_02245 [Candidatus Woesebacteria bacterium RIFCSPHIGHO2_02_FULL_38_9]OGM58144.1 MAG: hypothetical protein A3A50_00065 [Candidatus Woesebacteria bacterium RIFCSPLOWO2_01_FULL_38_20]
MTKVSVVILNWNQPDITLECLDSVTKLRVKDYELNLLIVDNGSTDNSVKIFEKLKIVNWKLEIISNGKNKGFAGGNNVGIKYALEKGADYILILNNDTIVDLQLVDRFIDTADKYPEVGMLSPKIYFANGYEFHKNRYKKDELGKVIWSAGGKMDWDNVFGKNRGVDEVDKGQFGQEKEVNFTTGACMFLSVKALNEVGIFDEKYFMYFEDADLCMRMKKFGWKILYSPSGLVWHKVAQSSRIGSDLNDYYITRNRLLFGMKYAPVRTKIALIKESIKFLISGRKWQKIGVRDFCLMKFGKGSWK